MEHTAWFSGFHSRSFPAALAIWVRVATAAAPNASPASSSCPSASGASDAVSAARAGATCDGGEAASWDTSTGSRRSKRDSSKKPMLSLRKHCCSERSTCGVASYIIMRQQGWESEGDVCTCAVDPSLYHRARLKFHISVVSNSAYVI